MNAIPHGPNGGSTQPIVELRSLDGCGVMCACQTEHAHVFGMAMRVPAGGRIYRAADYRTPPYTPRGRS